MFADFLLVWPPKQPEIAPSGGVAQGDPQKQQRELRGLPQFFGGECGF